MLRCTVAKFTWQVRRIFRAQSRERSLEAGAIPPSTSRTFARSNCAVAQIQFDLEDVQANGKLIPLTVFELYI